MKFKVGDRVEGPFEMFGTILKINSKEIIVKFDTMEDEKALHPETSLIKKHIPEINEAKLKAVLKI